MGKSKTWRRFRTISRWLLLLLMVYAVLGTGLRLLVPPPDAVGLAGPVRNADVVRFFHDDSWLDEQAKRHLAQGIFDELFRLIDNAEQLILIDMFLFNAWQGPVPENHRQLALELTDRLIARKSARPELPIIVISDPINTVYGSLQSVHFRRLEDAGIELVLTPLKALQDSNPTWSGLWRLAFAPLGNAEGSTLPNPFGEGRVTLRSYLALLNFKANHRKLLIADNGDGALIGMVSSANPHDGSSAHRNVALQFGGVAAHDLLAGELALLNMAHANDLASVVEQATRSMHSADESSAGSTTLQVLSESRIHEAVLSFLQRTGPGDAVELAMFYLSDRHIIKQLVAARQRGATVRVLLDINSDAFGRTKNGVPNRPVAAELVAAGVDVRWCATDGEQCHAKWLHVQSSERHAFLLGSANFTRRNLHDFNLETNVLLQATSADPIVADMLLFFNDQWSNADGRIYSLAYQERADDSLWLTLQYRFMEFTGLSTF